jgi:hypothetical protein
MVEPKFLTNVHLAPRRFEFLPPWATALGDTPTVGSTGRWGQASGVVANGGRIPGAVAHGGRSWLDVHLSKITIQPFIFRKSWQIKYKKTQ